MTRSFGLPPVARDDARVLLLGSLPGQRSLEAQEYYAQKRNVFWRLMASLFAVQPDAPYAERLRKLTENRVALWDVCGSAHRPGSLDHRIDLKTVEPNDFVAFFEVHPHVELICFNGRTAEHLYQRLALPKRAKTACLPSSSPAHAALTFEQKLEKWRAAFSDFLPERTG